jgi:hypothetical protein
MKVQVSEHESVTCSVGWNIQPLIFCATERVNKLWILFSTFCFLWVQIWSCKMNMLIAEFVLFYFVVVCFCFCCFYVDLLFVIWIAKGENVCGWLYNYMLQRINNLIVLKSCFQLLVESMLFHSLTLCNYGLNLCVNPYTRAKWRLGQMEKKCVILFSSNSFYCKIKLNI